jgi:valyl-tRNA synthetase
VEWLIALIGNLRAAKVELGLAPGSRLAAYLPEPSEATRGIITATGGD